MSKTTGLISLTAAGTAALIMTAMAGASSAAVFPSSPRLLTATVAIVDQQSPILDANGNPITDPDTGLPETLDDTSVNLTASFLGNILQPIAGSPGGVTANITTPVAGILDIAIEPAGFCASLNAASGASPDLRKARLAQPFRIPLVQLRNVPGGQAFEGLTEEGAIFVSPDAAATAEAMEPMTGATFESEGSNFYDGDPWANLTITPGLLILPGTLKLDGITDLSALLGTPKLKVDVLIDVLQLQQASLTQAPAAPPATPACITVPATVTVVPVEAFQQLKQ